MKTTLDIQDELMVRAKRHAKRIGRPLRAVVEEGLRLVLAEAKPKKSYVMPDCSVGDPDAEDPLEMLSWQDLRQEIYAETRRK
jgi:hypothetical protein